jgi:hypothetical protein
VTAEALLIAEADFGARAFASRLPGIGWLVARESGALSVVDEQLTEVARFNRRSTWRGHHWVTSDLKLAALSERDRISMIDTEGRELWTATHHPWGNSGTELGSCWISSDGRFVWATVPSSDGPDEWCVLDAGDGRVLGKARLNCYAAGSDPIPHPDGIHIGLSVGEGQDGAEVYWGRWQGEPRVARLDARDRVLCAVRPDGRHYLATPHGSGSNVLTVHAFPGGDVRARLDPKGILGNDDWFDFQAGYATNDVVLAGSVEGQRHFALAADTLAAIDEVAYPKNAALGGISPTGRGTWLTSDYLTGRHHLWQGPWR